MKLHNRQLLTGFILSHPDVKPQLEAWCAEAERATWDTPHDMKQRYPKASIIGGQETVFNICGSKYRLLTLINYQHGIVLAKAIGTHKEYDKWRLGQ